MNYKRLLCFGDSNTYGWIGSLSSPTQRYPSHIRWTGRIAKELGPTWEIIEEGLGGRTLCDKVTEGSGMEIPGAGLSAMDFMPACILSHLPLDGVIIMLGSNDMKAVLNHSEYDIADSMEKLVDMIQTFPWNSLLDYPHPYILLISPPIIGERKMQLSGARYNNAPQKSRNLAALYQKIADRKNVHFLDAATAIAGTPWGEAHGIDGMHLNEEDHARLSDAILKKIHAIYLKTS